MPNGNTQDLWPNLIADEIKELRKYVERNMGEMRKSFDVIHHRAGGTEQFQRTTTAQLDALFKKVEDLPATCSTGDALSARVKVIEDAPKRSMLTAGGIGAGGGVFVAVLAKLLAYFTDKGGP